MDIHHSINLCGEKDAAWVVFIHGLTCDHTDWQPVVDLVSLTHHCLSVDLRGHGQSVSLPGPYSMRNLANDVVALINNMIAEKSITVVSHSMGTRVAIAVSDTLESQVLHQVFVDGSRQAYGEPESTRQSILNTLNDSREYTAFVENLFGMMFSEKAMSAFGSPIVDRAKAIPREVFRELLSEMHWFDCETLGESLRQLASRGNTRLSVLQSTRVDRDSIRRSLEQNETSEYLEMIREMVPSSEITVIEKTGHFIQIEQPQVVAKAISDPARG